MDKQQLTYIEDSGIVFEQLGMTRMAGRIFGYLAVSDKSEASFDEIRQALNASKGSISGTTKQLVNAGLVRPVSLPGDRKTYYRLNQVAVGQLLKSRIQLFDIFADLLSRGRKLKKSEDEVSEWLKEVSAFYTWVGDEINAVIDRWENVKDDILKS
jgi:DNA-binding transcriptional regulator GbsR (MarR family)